MQSVKQKGEKINSPRQLMLDFFYDTLPPKPYCTDDLGALLVRMKNSAIKRRYIQPNSPFDLRWFLFDVDRPTAHFDWQDLRCPPPNITAMNPDNGHAHLFYALKVPVIMYDQNPAVSRKPMRYAGAIDVALTEKLDADRGFAKLIAKNPAHKHWTTHIWQEAPYDLDWLAGWLDLSPYRDMRKRLPPVGLGRNCTLFDLSRHWAYQRRGRDDFPTLGKFHAAVTDYLHDKNTSLFQTPLFPKEIKGIAKSVSGWTWEKIPAGSFRGWCSMKGKASGKVRKKKAETRALEIREFKKLHPNMSQRMLAEVFNVAAGTINTALKPRPYGLTSDLVR